MKPLGTITNYYQFVDGETRATLDSIMKSAYNYGDFVHLLVDRVCNEESSDTLIFLAVFHSYILVDSRTLEKLGKKYRNHSLVLPFMLWRDTYFFQDTKGCDEAKESIESVLSSKPDDWVKVLMYDLAQVVGGLISPGCPYQLDSIDKMEELISSNESLSCFRPYLLNSQARLYSFTDSIRLREFSELLYEAALECDDMVHALIALTRLVAANTYQYTPKALRLVEKASMLADQLGCVYSQGVIRNQEGILHATRGEYDLSIEKRLESLRLSDKTGDLSMGVGPRNIAYIYNELGNGEAALEWTNAGLSTSKKQPRDLPYVYFDRAKALTLLGRLDEARDDLDAGTQMALKVSNELLLEQSYIATGMLELAEGRPEDAMQSFERSLEIACRVGRQNRINSCLLRLTECELSMFEITEENKSAEYTGKWMEKLEKEVTEKDLPGIRGLFLLLQAELRLMQERRGEAEDLMREIRNLSQQPGLGFLDEKVASLEALVEQ